MQSLQISNPPSIHCACLLLSDTLRIYNTSVREESRSRYSEEKSTTKKINLVVKTREPNRSDIDSKEKEGDCEVRVDLGNQKKPETKIKNNEKVDPVSFLSD